jgi:hypothetical protein
MTALQLKVDCYYPQQLPAPTENNMIDPSNEIDLTGLPSSSTRLADTTKQLPKPVDKHTTLTKSVTITVEPQTEDLRMESADDILARQVQIENARDAKKK